MGVALDRHHHPLPTMEPVGPRHDHGSCQQVRPGADVRHIFLAVDMVEVADIDLVPDVGDSQPVEEIQLYLLVNTPRNGYLAVTAGNHDLDPCTKCLLQYGRHVSQGV